MFGARKTPGVMLHSGKGAINHLAKLELRLSWLFVVGKIWLLGKYLNNLPVHHTSSS